MPDETATAEPEAPTVRDEASSDALAIVAPDVPAALARQPIIDQINPRQLALLEAKTPTLNHAERAQGLELCAMYQLDPFANEVWFTKGAGSNGSEGRLLIMVGRNGLRKIAQRNGLEVDADVVRVNDMFQVERDPDTRERRITHEYSGDDETRGEIRGAWCEVYERETRHQRGFFYAPIGEYMPTNERKRQYSPWGSQVSVMILAAAERSAIAQATPLGGLVAPGELDRAREAAAPTPEEPVDRLADVVDDPDLAAEVVAVVRRARELGHVGYSDVGTVEMTVRGQSTARVREWLEQTTAELDAMRQAEVADDDAEPVDAEVVDEPTAPEPTEPTAPAEESADDARDPESVPEDAPDGSDGDAAPGPDPEAAQALEHKAVAALDAADAAEEAGDTERAGELREEGEGYQREAEALRSAEQGRMDL